MNMNDVSRVLLCCQLLRPKEPSDSMFLAKSVSISEQKLNSAQ